MSSNTIDPQDVAKRLEAMQAGWGEAKAEFVPGDRVPDGTYETVIKDFDFFEGKNGQAAGKLFIKTVFEVRHHATLNGAEASAIHNLEDPERFGYVKRHFSKLGVEVDDLPMTELRPGSDTLKALLDVPVEIAVKSSDKTDVNGVPYQNVYVNQRLGDSLGSDVTTRADLEPKAQATTDDDDNIPF